MDRLSAQDLLRPGVPEGIRVPTPADLFDALENILWFWPGIFVQWVKEGREKQDLGLSRSMKLTGQYDGLVILRTSETLGQVLANSLLADKATSPEDAFNEFSNMFCGHIMNKIRVSDETVFRHFLPRPTLEIGPPNRPPDARMTVAIESIVLDVQLWINPEPVDPKKA